MRFATIILLGTIFILLAGCTTPATGRGGEAPVVEPPAAPTPNPAPSPSPEPAAASPSPEPVPSTAVPEPSPVPVPAPAPLLVNGKTLDERLQEAQDRLHTQGSGPHIRRDFPDIELVYTDSAESTWFPNQILPFRYYYSPEADRTFNICNIDLTVFICEGKLDRLITKEDIESGRCEATPIYKSDQRLGYSGYESPGEYTYSD